MNIAEAKSQIIELLELQLGKNIYSNIVDPSSPDHGDEGKFTIYGKPARVIHRFNGWNVPINTSWFSGTLEEPTIKGTEFYWYAFAIPKYSGFAEKHYYICDYLRMRKFVLDFDVVSGKDYKDSRYWRADIQPFHEQAKSGLGYFRWGDEPLEKQDNPLRIIRLDNINEILNLYEAELRTPSRAVAEISRIIRDTILTKRLKNIHKNQCQICGTAIGPSDCEYSEVHHIMPLGIPHNGPDSINNMIVLCPNHHAEFDYGYIAIEPSTLQIVHIDPRNQFNGAILRRKSGHEIAVEYLKYHYDNIFIRYHSS